MCFQDVSLPDNGGARGAVQGGAGGGGGGGDAGLKV